MLALISLGILVGSACSSDGSAAKRSSGSTAPTSAPGPKSPATTVNALLALGRPIVLAHAGGDDSHPHSTPYGFAASVRDGVDALDMDVQLSKDGVLVVQHDATVDRTTNGHGKVADLTYAELRKLDNAYWFTRNGTGPGHPESDYILRGVRTGDKPPPAGYRSDDFVIPRFTDIAKRFPDYVLNIEIKGSYPDAVPAAKALAKDLAALHRDDSAVVTSFDDKVVAAFHDAAPTVTLTPGLGETANYVLTDRTPASGRILQIPPEFSGVDLVTPDFIARAHGDHLLLWIWPDGGPYENEAGYGRLLQLGVDGLNAARPAEAVAALTAFDAKS